MFSLFIRPGTILLAVRPALPPFCPAPPCLHLPPTLLSTSPLFSQAPQPSSVSLLSTLTLHVHTCLPQSRLLMLSMPVQLACDVACAGHFVTPRLTHAQPPGVLGWLPVPAVGNASPAACCTCCTLRGLPLGRLVPFFAARCRLAHGACSVASVASSASATAAGSSSPRSCSAAEAAVWSVRACSIARSCAQRLSACTRESAG